MKFLTAMVVCWASMLASGVSSAQNSNMMNAGGMWSGVGMGGYWGFCWPSWSAWSYLPRK
jgi:hypothetical protein